MTLDLSSLSPRRILVCQLRQIGDVVVSTACVELLAERYPDAEIHFLTESKCAPVLENNPRIARTWSIDPAQGFLATIDLALSLRRERFDLLIDFQRLPRTALAAGLSGVPVRLAPIGKWYKRLPYSHFAGRAKGGYAGKLKASLLEPLGIQWNNTLPRMFLSPDEQAWAEANLHSQGFTNDHILVSVDATHWSVTRRWPEEYWAKWLKMVADLRPELRFYLLHGPGERAAVDRIIALSGQASRCLTPPADSPPSLRQAAAVIAQAALHVGNCSAPRHMAVALDVPTLTIIGANGSTAWTFPNKTRHRVADMRVPCRKCNKNSCSNGTLRCLKSLSPEFLAKHFLAMLHDFDNHMIL